MVNKEGDIAVLITPMSDHLIFKGYRQDTDGNAKFVRPERVDKQGRRWYTTGDRGYVDDDGYFWFVGREDDVCLPRILLTTGDKLLGLPNRSFRSGISVEGNATANRANCRSILVLLNLQLLVHLIRSAIQLSRPSLSCHRCIIIFTMTLSRQRSSSRNFKISSKHTQGHTNIPVPSNSSKIFQKQ